MTLQSRTPSPSSSGFTDAGSFGFSPDANGLANAAALQRTVDQGGTIVVSRPGVYRMAATVYVGSRTSLLFGNGVVLRKVVEAGPFAHVLLNKGALTKTMDEDITIDGLHIEVNGVDCREWQVYGLHGQLSFFYAKDVRIQRFRCLDLGPMQYGIHVCTFEDLLVDDVIIKGEKDGVHLGRGNRFTIRNGVFQTFDDAIALNGHDYSTGNPELGWIENGLIENCHDLNAENTTGFFCRILAGAWRDWEPGMEVQQSDTVVSEGRLYRVQAEPDGTFYTSNTRPQHASGRETLDGIGWGVVQDDVVYTAGVRCVTFRDIFLEKPRTAFSIHFDTGRYSRSYYPGSEIPVQEQIVFERVRVLHNEKKPLLATRTPIDALTVSQCSLRQNVIRFGSIEDLKDYGPTRVTMLGCVFQHDGYRDVLVNRVDGKEIVFKTLGSLEMGEGFSAGVEEGPGRVVVDSDLTGLRD